MTVLKFASQRDKKLATLPALYAEQARLEVATRRNKAAIFEAENEASNALGYRMTIRGPMLLEAMNRSVK